MEVADVFVHPDGQSTARRCAVEAIRILGRPGDQDDWRLRDQLIAAMSPHIDAEARARGPLPENKIASYANVAHIKAWMLEGEKLRDPALAFTAGPERELADLIYRVSQVLERCAEAASDNPPATTPNDPVAFCHSPLLIHGEIRKLLPGFPTDENGWDGYHLKVSRSMPTGTREQLDAVTAEILKRINGWVEPEHKK